MSDLSIYVSGTCILETDSEKEGTAGRRWWGWRAAAAGTATAGAARRLVDVLELGEELPVHLGAGRRREGGRGRWSIDGDEQNRVPPKQ